MISLACHLSSFIFSCFKSYTILCIWRGVSGALVTSSLPIFLSILGDIFPSSQRSTASVVSSIVVGLGQLMGQTLSGFIGSKFGWRSFFQLTSTLGLLSILCLKFVEFPHNGEADGLRIPRPESTDKLKSESTNVMQINESEIEISMELEGEGMKLNVSILKDVFKIRSNWLLFLQGLPGSMPWGVYTIYLHNILCVERKFSIDLASTLILVFGVGAALGSAVAGIICSFLCSFNKSLLPVAVSVCYFLSLPLIASLFRLTTDSFTVILHSIVLFFLGLLLSIPGPCIRMMLLNVNRPQCRSTVIAVSEVFNNIGRILGPIVFIYLTGFENRIDSLIMTTEYFYIAGIICFVLFYTYADDEQAVLEYIASIQKQLQHTDVEVAHIEPVSSETPLFDMLPNCESISPDPASLSPTVSTNSLQRVVSIESFRAASEGVGSVLRRVKNVISGMDTRSLRNSLVEAGGVHGEDHLEEAPLLVKV